MENYTKLTVDREVYTQQCIVVNRTISAAKTNYYKDMINDCGSDQGELFKKIDRMFKMPVEEKYPTCASSEQLANNFADFFDNKIDSIKKDLSTKSANLLCSHIMDTTLLSKDTKLE